MKKLKIKTFITIFVILTIFLVTILFIANYQDYARAKRSIEENLLRINPKDIVESIMDNPNKLDNVIERKRFIDATIYTIILDDANIKSIISHTEDGFIDDNVKTIAKEIIKKNQNNSLHIGNLYFSNYSYNYVLNRYIILMDNTETRSRLLTTLNTSIILFIMLEIMIFMISFVLARWITKPAEESFNKQKQFIADASHELKTPLAVIMASSEALENDRNKKKWIKNIQNEADRMNKLIASLLELARLDDENIQIQYEMNNLSKITEKSILTLESLIFEKEINLDYHIDKNIKLYSNIDEIKQLLTILLDNAIKHTDKDGNIVVELNENKNNISLKIKNTGSPIPKGEEEKIFERFYRIDKARNRSQNRYGLGLAIAKSIVQNHNGKIFASSDNKYTIFTVMFKKKNINTKI